MTTAERDSLFHAHLDRGSRDGAVSEADIDRLETLLRSDPAARDAYLKLADLHACMAVDEMLWVPSGEDRPSTPPRPISRAGWKRSVAAALGGLLAGLFGAGLVFAYVLPMAWKPVPLVVEDFEGPSPPRSLGMAVNDGAWSGDHSLVVTAERGVAARDGRRMLRMLRADYEGKPTQPGYSADLYRVIDVRPHRELIASGHARLRVAMPFNAAPFPADEEYVGSVGIYALDASVDWDALSGDTGFINEAAIAMARTGTGRCDRDPRTWQVAQNELRLPPTTAFVLIHLGIAHATSAQRRETFDGHYLDGVRVHLEFAQQETRP